MTKRYYEAIKSYLEYNHIQYDVCPLDCKPVEYIPHFVLPNQAEYTDFCIWFNNNSNVHLLELLPDEEWIKFGRKMLTLEQHDWTGRY